VTVEYLCHDCHKPIKPGLKKNKANCQCVKPVAGAALVTIRSSTVERNPANPFQLGGSSTELAKSVKEQPLQYPNGSELKSPIMKDISSATCAGSGFPISGQNIRKAKRVTRI
jgi:hypothetical protein